jgi:hypothetical protein
MASQTVRQALSTVSPSLNTDTRVRFLKGYLEALETRVSVDLSHDKLSRLVAIDRRIRSSWAGGPPLEPEQRHN